MAMTVLVTRNAADRVRGFLASCMCEVAPGVYVSGTMNKAVRTRVWTVMQRWFVLGRPQSASGAWSPPPWNAALRGGGVAGGLTGPARIDTGRKDLFDN